MANQKSTTVLLQAGLDKAIGAGAYPTFALKYFVPIYDHRTDINVHTDIGEGFSTDAIATSASVSSSAIASILPTNIEGDILWQNDTAVQEYRIDENKNILYVDSGTDISSNVVSTDFDSAFEQITIIEEGGNTYTPQKVSTIAISGTNVTYNGSGQFNSDSGWTQLSESPTLNDDSTWDHSRLLDTIVFSGRNGNTGTYTITIPDSYGTTKVNKILILIQQVDAQGNNSLSVDPIPFAMVCLKDPVNIYSSTDPNNETSVNGASFRVAMNFSPTTSAEVNYTIDEFWSKATATSGVNDGPDPISYKGDILLGPGDGPGTTLSPQAKLDVIRKDGKVARFADDDYSIDKGWLLNLSDDAISLFDEEGNFSSTKSVSFSKGKPVVSYTHNIDMLNNFNGINTLEYSIVNGYDISGFNSMPVNKISNSLLSSSSSTIRELNNSLHAGNGNSLYEINDSSVVGSSVTLSTVNDSIVAGNSSTAVNVIRSLLLNNTTSLQNVTDSIVIGQSITATGSIDGSLINLSSFVSVDSLTNVIAHGSSNTVSSSLQYGHILSDTSDFEESISHFQSLGSGHKVNTDYTYIKGQYNKSYSSNTHSALSQHIYINGFRNNVEYDSSATAGTLFDNKFVNVYGDGNWVRNSRNTYILGGYEQASAVNASSNQNSVQFSDRAHVIGNQNKIKNSTNSFTLGVLNEIDMSTDTASDVFQNNTLVGISNKIYADGQGVPSVNNVSGVSLVGYQNVLEADPSHELNASFTNMYGNFNAINVINGSGDTASSINSINLIGSSNVVNHNQYNSISGLIVAGNNNQILENTSNSGSPSIGIISNVAMFSQSSSAYYSAYTTTEADIANLANISFYGNYGYVTASDINGPYHRHWSDPTSALDVSSPGNNVAGHVRSVIMNGIDSNADYGVAMTFGHMDISTTGANTSADQRQIITIPLCDEYTQYGTDEYLNPFNKQNKEYGIPSRAELEALAAVNKFVPRGTLCYDNDGVGPDYVSRLLVWDPDQS